MKQRVSGRSGSRPPGVPRRVHFSKERLDKLPLPDADAGGRASYYVFDDDVRALGLRVWSTGRKVYVVRTRMRSTQRWLVVGEHGQPAPPTAEDLISGEARTWTPEEARREARRLLGIVASGADPGEARRLVRGAPTLREAARVYAEDMRARKRPSTWDADMRLLGLEDLRAPHRAISDPKCESARRILDEPFAARRLPEILRADIEGMMRRWSATPIRANRAAALLSHIFAWARVEPNPARGVERFAEEKRRRYVSGEELARLGRALAENAEAGEDPHALAAIRVLLFTGARRAEVLGLRWQHAADGCTGHVDFERSVAVLHESKTGQKELVLPPPALEVLHGVERVPGNAFIFAGESEGKPFQGIGHTWGRVRARAGLGDVRLHDLRHTFASAAVSGGASLAIIGGLLGHASTSTTQRYAHLQLDPLRVAAEAAASALAAGLAGSPPAPVVPLRRPRGGAR